MSLEIVLITDGKARRFTFFVITKISVQGDHSACAKPPVDFKTKVPLRPGQARPGQIRTFVSTGDFAPAEWSPCTLLDSN